MSILLSFNRPRVRHFDLAKKLTQSFREKMISHGRLADMILNSYDSSVQKEDLYEHEYHCQVVLLNKALLQIGVGYTLQSIRTKGYILTKKEQPKADKFACSAWAGFQALERANNFQQTLHHKKLGTDAFWEKAKKYGIIKKSLPQSTEMMKAMTFSVKLLAESIVQQEDQQPK